MIRSKKSLLLALALVLLIAFLGPLSATLFYLTEAFAQKPLLNKGMAIGFVFVGFLSAHLSFINISLPVIKRLLTSYIFFAVGMSGLYFLIYISHSGCFTFTPKIVAPSVFDFLYFSFVTVTTLGYGDIVPNHPFLRLLVVVQILFGVFLIFSSTAFRQSRDTATQLESKLEAEKEREYENSN